MKMQGLDLASNLVLFPDKLRNSKDNKIFVNVIIKGFM